MSDDIPEEVREVFAEIHRRERVDQVLRELDVCGSCGRVMECWAVLPGFYLCGACLTEITKCSDRLKALQTLRNDLDPA